MRNNRKFVLLMGPPGSGKNRIGIALRSTGCFFHFSSGNLFRAILANEVNFTVSENDKHEISRITRGEFVPESIAMRVLCNYIEYLDETLPSDMIILLDGFPRTQHQAQYLLSNMNVSCCLYLNVDDQTIKSRIANRGVVEGRVDDMSADVVEKRIAVFKKEIAGVLEECSSSAVEIVKINASLHILNVLMEILHVIINMRQHEVNIGA